MELAYGRFRIEGYKLLLNGASPDSMLLKKE